MTFAEENNEEPMLVSQEDGDLKREDLDEEGKFEDYENSPTKAQEEEVNEKDEYQLRVEEAEARRQEECRQNYAFLEFLKVIMANDKRIETIKDTIAKHQFFNASDLFYECDENKDGLLSADEFANGCL